MPGKDDKNRKSGLNYTNSKKWSEQADQGGGFKPTAFKVPAGMETHRWVEGKNRIVVMPYRVGKNNPQADEGAVHFERTYFTHNNMGPNEDAYSCPNQCSGGKKKCPVCEVYFRLKREGKTDKDTLNAIKAKQRQLFIFLDVKAQDKGFQIHEESFWFGFGELLKAKLDAQDEGSTMHDFFHLDGGMILNVTCKKQAYPGGTRIAATNIEMEPRKKVWPESILKELPCLDDLILIKSYDELKALYEGEEVEEEGGEKPAGGRKPKAKVEDDDDFGSDDVDEKPAAKRKKGKVEEEPEDDDIYAEEGGDEDKEAEVGNTVSFTYKGEELEGTVAKIGKSKQSGKPLATVEVEGREKPCMVLVEDLTVLEADGEPDEEEPEEEEEVEEKPKSTKKVKKTKEPEPEVEDDDTDGSSDDDDDGDFGFGEDDDTPDDDEPEEKPKVKAKKAKK
jgi:hypothetical protein